MKNKILVKRHYLLIENQNDKNAPYFACKLLNQFGVVVDKPKKLSRENVATIAEFYGTKIPEGFYRNPQDTKFYTCKELLIEQLVSYFLIENVTGVYSMDNETFKRRPIFKTAVPFYLRGDEMKLRNYKLITEEESTTVLKEILINLCSYTRPWSLDESNEMFWLYMNGYYDDEPIKCKDNIIEMFIKFKLTKFSSKLDKKDVVKLSLRLNKEKKEFTLSDEGKTIIAIALQSSKDCVLSKKQAKYFNTLIKKTGIKMPLVSNKNNPYSITKKLVKEEKVLEAAKVLAQNGSLLQRNLIWLLSRATLDECDAILKMVGINNPIVLIQLMLSLTADDYKKNRVFRFTKDRRVKSHIETEYEHKYRKSILSIGMKKHISEVLNEKIALYYKNLKPLGKIFISEEFKKIGLPLNTSAMGGGLDVLPTGSRLEIKGDFIRSFCYWKDAFDIDASVIFIKEDGERKCLYWGNSHLKEFGESALTSGDDRSANGAEFIDFKIKEIKELGYKYAIFTLNGFGSSLNEGEIYCGYQNKNNLNTEVWEPKNIELKIQVKGDTRAYIGYGIDFETNEIVILNSLLASGNRVVSDYEYKAVEIYLNSIYLTSFNMYKLLCLRGEITTKPEEADVVFDRDYIASANQTVIRPYDKEKLVNLLK